MGPNPRHEMGGGTLIGRVLAQLLLGILTRGAFLLLVVWIAAGSESFLSSYLGNASRRLITSIYPGAATFGRWEWVAGAIGVLYVFRASAKEAKRLRGRKAPGTGLLNNSR